MINEQQELQYIPCQDGFILNELEARVLLVACSSHRDGAD